MNRLFDYFPPNLLLALGSGVVVIILIFLTLLGTTINGFLKLLGKKSSSTKFYLSTKLLGTLAVVTLAFAADSLYVYFFAIIIIASIFTDLEFIEKVVAIISNSSSFFQHKTLVDLGRVSTQESLTISDKEKTELSSELKKDRDSLMLWYHFERTYRLIFGTQLTILRIASSDSNKRIHTTLAQSLYSRTSLTKTYLFSSYINFLTTSQLITYNSTTNSYTITSLGEAFLRYLSTNNIPLTKLN